MNPKVNTMFFLKLVFVFCSYFHYTAHVHFIKSGEHRRCIFCFYQPAGNRFTEIDSFFPFKVAAKQCFSRKTSGII